MRPWAFIGGGGQFAYIRRELGWVRMTADPAYGVDLVGDTHRTDGGEGRVTYQYVLDRLALRWESEGKDGNIDPALLPARWGHRMTPVWPDEEINFTMKSEDI